VELRATKVDPSVAPAVREQLPVGATRHETQRDVCRSESVGDETATFEKLSPTERRRFVGWICTAKQHETKRRRIRESIRPLADGKKLGLK
jgi:hypothetical protein